MPSRKQLDFSSPLFHGCQEERKKSTQRKTEEIQKELSRITRRETRKMKVPKITKLATGHGHYEPANPTLVKNFTAGSDTCQIAAMFTTMGGAVVTAIPAATAFLTVAGPPIILGTALMFLAAGTGFKKAAVSDDTEKWVEDKRESLVDEIEDREVDVKYITKQNIRRTSEREGWEIYKVFHDTIKIFQSSEYGPWTIICDEPLDIFETEAPEEEFPVFDLPQEELPEKVGSKEKMC